MLAELGSLMEAIGSFEKEAGLKEASDVECLHSSS